MRRRQAVDRNGKYLRVVMREDYTLLAAGRFLRGWRTGRNDLGQRLDCNLGPALGRWADDDQLANGALC